MGKMSFHYVQKFIKNRLGVHPSGKRSNDNRSEGPVRYIMPSENFYFSLNTFTILFLKTKGSRGKSWKA